MERGTFCENVVKSFKPRKIYRPCSTGACIGKNGDLLVAFFLLEGGEAVLHFDLAILFSFEYPLLKMVCAVIIRRIWIFSERMILGSFIDIIESFVTLIQITFQARILISDEFNLTME